MHALTPVALAPRSRWPLGLLVGFAWLAVAIPSALAASSNWVVVRRVRLYDEPRSSSPHLRTLAKGERVSSVVMPGVPEVDGSYRHVRTSQGEVGWCYAPYLAEIETPAPPTDEPIAGLPPDVAALATTLDADGQRLLAYVGRQMEACPSEPDCPADNLDECPPCGCAEPWSGKALQVIMKRRLPWQDEDPDSWLGGARPIRLSHQQFLALQQATNSPDASGKMELSFEERLRTLRGLAIAGGGGTITLNEGDYVELVGFVAQDRNVEWGGGESVNCKFAGENPEDPDQPHADIHVPIVPGSSGKQCESIVVEPIPQFRPEAGAWWPGDFNDLKTDKTQLMIRGTLFYDNEHKVRDCAHKNAQGLSSQPQRISLWEIHPVVEILRCKHGSGCDPDDSSDWARVR